MKYNFETKEPLMYIDKKIDCTINFKCYGFIELQYEDKNIINIVLDNLQKFFNIVNNEFSFLDLQENSLFNEVMIRYYNNLILNNKVINMNISSFVPDEISSKILIQNKKIICIKCGHILKKDELFCSECGTKYER